MKSFRPRTFAWLLIGSFGLAHGVGEGWHYVPGNGHLVELPGGCLFVGVVRPYPALSCDDGPAHLQPSRARTVPSAGEVDCPICRLVAQAQWLMLACFGTLPSLAEYVASRPLYFWHAPVFHPFDARAPPGEPMVSALRMCRAA